MSENPEQPNKVLIVATSHDQLGASGKKTGAYLSEITHPYAELIRAGFEVDFASPRGGRPPLDGLEDQDVTNAECLKDPQFLSKLETSIPTREVDTREYAAVMIAGGHGTMYDLPEDPGLQNIIKNIYQSGGVVAAVCHGPAGLVNAQLGDGSYLVSGKAVSAFTNEEEDLAGTTAVMPFLLEDRLIERGAKIVKAEPFAEQISISGRLITGQNPASAGPVGRAIVRAITAK